MHLLVLQTGGTIAMVRGPDGLAPDAGIVQRELQRLAPPGADLFIRACDPLVDSAEIGPMHWNWLIGEIAAFVHATRGAPSGGVVVTHGTDTMAFTGAALAQALAGIAIPVILCGAMRPLNAEGDARENLTLALEAVQGGANGIWLAFGGRLLAAAGLVKRRSDGEDAFGTVPQPPTGRHYQPRRFDADLRIAILTLSPGLPAPAMAAMLAGLDGAVLRVYGAGTVMSDPDLLAALSGAIERGCRIRAVSQCESGGLAPGTYAAGAALWRAGVENGGTETPEAALVRLWLELSE